MNTKIGNSPLARSRRPGKPDLTTVWAPLVGLADAAERVSEGRAVVIARGFDRNNRQRAKALRDILDERGVPAIEVTPAPGSERLTADTEVSAVVNLLAAGSWQPYRLAAKLCAPLLTPNPAEDAPGAEVRRDVIGVSSDDTRDIALSHVDVRPENPTTSTLLITSDNEPLALPGGWITLTPGEHRLRVRLGAPDFAEQSFESEQVRVETLDGPHRLVRDELPIAEFEGTVVFAAEAAGLVIRPV